MANDVLASVAPVDASATVTSMVPPSYRAMSIVRL